ncbi:hypothetical protein B0T17DRAFT_651931 [Bombardia bombarda]|uniref:FAD-binding domain-containing protein n=1 Tax=Bombardia bombarda TaxID=252184 RepID=A0AA39XNL7_9PEZI|nr:hypothetical protein B0T17DRAFT_651931 [Bombardia bombarda]
MNFDIRVDWAEQAVSNNELDDSQQQHTIVEYKTFDGTLKSTRTSWLIGADGKTGVVRKEFLEPVGIKQNLFTPWLSIATSSLSKFPPSLLPPAQTSSQKTTPLPKTISFPRDCVTLLRCRPFNFATKVVNRWYHNSTLLIGNAAHVFPPFGGQGIACGIRDAMLSSPAFPPLSKEKRERSLAGWAQERTHAWRGAMLATKLNGSIVNQKGWLRGVIFCAAVGSLWRFGWVAKYRANRAFRDKLAFTEESCPDGFFLEGKGGGRKMSQVWVRREGERPVLSDAAVLGNLAYLSLIVFVRKGGEWFDFEGERRKIAEVVKVADLLGGMLTLEDVTFYNLAGGDGEKGLEVETETETQTYTPYTTEELAEEGITPINGYHHGAMEKRYPATTRFMLVRPDFLVHSVGPMAISCWRI